jgi:hypothetical protein
MAIHAMGPTHALGVHAMTSMNIHVAATDDLLHHPPRAFPLWPCTYFFLLLNIIYLN